MVCRQCNQDIEEDPDNAKAYLNRAICYMHSRNYEETLNDAMQSTKLNDARYMFLDRGNNILNFIDNHCKNCLPCMRPLQHLAPDSTSVGANGLTGDVVGWTALIYHVTFTKVQNCSIHG